MKKKSSYDFYLVLATAAVLFIISVICVYGMFYFKLAQIHQMNLIRCELRRPYQPLFVVILLSDAGKQPSDANSV